MRVPSIIGCRIFVSSDTDVIYYPYICRFRNYYFNIPIFKNNCSPFEITIWHIPLRALLFALRSSLFALRSWLFALRSSRFVLGSWLFARRSSLLDLRSWLLAVRSSLLTLRSAIFDKVVSDKLNANIL